MKVEMFSNPNLIQAPYYNEFDKIVRWHDIYTINLELEIPAKGMTSELSREIINLNYMRDDVALWALLKENGYIDNSKLLNKPKETTVIETKKEEDDYNGKTIQNNIITW